MTGPLDRLRTALAKSYEIQRELGRGGMATVYLATDLRHERQVAIKVLRPELAAAVGSERFLREIKTTAQLSNPHILPLLDSGDADGTLFYVMPYVEGESLRDRLKRETQLPLDDAVAIGLDVAAALSYAHSRGIIHRDIKPENILLSMGEAVVADFGIARAVTEAAGERLTETGLAIGTPAYMSPEQGTGSSAVDARTDIYSLGCVMYEMLAGEPPYTGPTPFAVIAKRLSEPVPRLATLRDVPDTIERAIAKSLGRVPADRWNTAADFAAALKGERGSPAPGVSVSVLPAPPARKRWLVPAGITAGTLAVLSVVAFAVWPRPRTEPPPPLAIPEGMVLLAGADFPLFGGECPLCIPTRVVTVDSVLIDRTEVTVGDYTRFVLAGRAPAPWKSAPASDVPVTGVMWHEADAYCRWRDPLARLPTEEEWEAAARGNDRRTYAWGTEWNAAWSNTANARRSVVAVGSFPPGAAPSGALDMIGNAWEWTATAGPAAADGSPQYVIRGGAFDVDRTVATTFFRTAFPPNAEGQRQVFYGNTGFRCARALR